MKKVFTTAVCALTALSSTLPIISSGAAQININYQTDIIGYYGDINLDMEINVADIVLLTQNLMNGFQLTEEQYRYADADNDGYVDSFDVVALRQMLLYTREPIADTQISDKYINPPIYKLYGSLPSQGDAKLAVFYVDFPDCKYDYEPSVEEIEDIAFGSENTDDSNYPYESFASYYDRSSNGVMQLSGNAFRYTTKNPKSYYEGDVWKINLIDEIMLAFNDTVDFSQFDGDGDGNIDAMLINVPNAAGDDEWWPCAGIYGKKQFTRYDKKYIGHVITGNSQINSKSDYKDFISSYCHELGHCLGLPDYYLYNGNDSQGLHGSAGYELMDDAMGDLSAASKLQLGWYKPDQIQVYDAAKGTQTFTLTNSQTENGNCLIIPYKYIDESFNNEFMILEYSDLIGNNTHLDTDFWWKKTGSGVRCFHVDAHWNDDYYYRTYEYSSGNDEETNYDQGHRFIRIIDDTEKDNFYRTGDIIDGNISGFHWYDDDGNQSLETGVTIEIGKLDNDSYTVTVSGGNEKKLVL